MKQIYQKSVRENIDFVLFQALVYQLVTFELIWFHCKIAIPCASLAPFTQNQQFFIAYFTFVYYKM